jgi:tetratricopeptide (TPR) repeat protein
VGDFYADLGKWDEALVQYRAGLQEASDKASYHKRMVRVYQALGKRQEAIAELSEILKSSPADVDSRLARAILLREDPAPKQRDLAMQEFQTLATQYPQNAIVHYNLALLYLNKGDTTTATREARKSADLQRDYVDPRLLEIEMAQTAQNYQAAVDKSAEVLAIDPKNLAARLMRASALVGGKAYREAEVELNDLSKLQPNSKDIDLVMASLDMAEKQYSKAQVLYERHYQQGSSDLRPLEGLIQCYVVNRQPEKAETLLSEELKQQPESQPIRMLLASVVTQEHKFDVAAAQYRWLQAKDPASAKAYAALGDLYQAQGATQDALASYEKASKLAPSDAKILNAIAVLESNTGQAKQAIATLDKQLALDPNNAAAMNNLAFNLAETGQDLDRALTLAERVARKFPNDPGVIDTLGWVYVKRGLNQSAIQVLRGLVKKYPKEPAYRYHLAIALIQDKQTVDARRELQAALLNHPAKDLSSKIQENLTQVR